MNIGIFFKHEKSGGGIYQYFLTIMDCIKSNPSEDRFFLFYCHPPDLLDEYRSTGIQTIALVSPETGHGPPASKKEPAAAYALQDNGRKISFKTRPYSHELFEKSKKYKIDLMIHTNAERESFEVPLPYLTAVHDWTHKTHPQFKEFVAEGVYEQREYIITHTVQKAESVLVDSQTAKDEIRTFYDIREDKIQILPFIPPPYFLEQCDPALVPDVKKLYSLPDPYIFYPAQFWPHKNHENILKALYLLKKEKAVTVSAVFVGSTTNKWSSYERVVALSAQLGLEKQIFHFGYVPHAHIKPLYQSALALVMPTFPGPTNIPVLEAFACECPVIASNHKALREQVGEAGLLIDPHSPEEIAAAIEKLFSNPDLRSRLILKGRQKITQWGYRDFCGRFHEILEQTKQCLSSSRKG